MHPTVFAILAKFGRSYKFGIVHFFLNWGMYVSVSFSTRGCIAAIWPISSRRSTTAETPTDPNFPQVGRGDRLGGSPQDLPTKTLFFSNTG